MLKLTQEQLDYVLTNYEGKLVEPKRLNGFQQFSVSFFTNPEKVSNPHVSFTTHLNISSTYKIYEAYYKDTPGATFTAYLKWCLLETKRVAFF